MRLCGEDFDFDEMEGLLTDIKGNLIVLTESIARALGLLSCENINSLYTNTFHQGTWYVGTDGRTLARTYGGRG